MTMRKSRQRQLVEELRTLRSKVTHLDDIHVAEDFSTGHETGFPKESRDKLNQILVDSMPCTAVLLESQTRRIVACNKTAKVIGAVVGKVCRGAVVGCTERCPLCKADEVVTVGQRCSVEIEHDGKWFNANWLALDNGLILHYAFDITQRKRQENIARQRNREFKNIIEHSTNMFYSHTPQQVLTYLSPQSVRFLGYEPKDAMTIWTEFSTDHPANQKAIESTNRAIETGIAQPPYEIQLRHKSGRNVWVEAHEAPVVENGKTVAVVGAMTDITERKQAEQALRESEQRFRKIMDTIHLIGVMLDTEGRITFANDFLLHSTGWTRKEILGKDWFKIFIPQEIRESLRESIFSEIMDIDASPSYHQDKIMTKTGQCRVIAWNNTSLQDDTGRVVGLASVGEDVTERINIEKALRRSEEKFRALFEQAAVGVAQVKDGKFLKVNKRYCDIIGYSQQEMLALASEQITHPDDIEQDRNKKRQFSQGLIDEISIEKRYIHKNGSIVWVYLTVSSMSNDANNEQGNIAVVKDITARKHAEEKLKDYQKKLKSLAITSVLNEERQRRHIARNLHDSIGQELAALKLKIQSSMRDCEDKHIAESADRMCTHINDMMEEVRDITFELSNPILTELGLEAALERHLVLEIHGKHGIKYEFNKCCLLCDIDEDLSACLFRTVCELLNNVVKHANAQNVRVALTICDDDIIIEVADDGVGFEAEKTKGQAAYGGFGLFSTCEQLESFGGLLQIDSAPDHGSLFTIIVPFKIKIS